jgi:hypothetical protein
MNITEMIMNEMQCNQGRRADARAAQRQVGGAEGGLFRKHQATLVNHRTSQTEGHAWMNQDTLTGLGQINYCTNSIQTAQARNEAAVF